MLRNKKKGYKGLKGL